jgi:hypothetical protein
MLGEIGNSAMNAPQCWQLHKETSANTPAFEEADSQWEQIFKCLADYGSETRVAL